MSNSIFKNTYETKAGRYAMTGLMKLIAPVRNTNNIVKGMRGRTKILVGSATNETIPENFIMNGSVKI